MNFPSLLPMLIQSAYLIAAVLFILGLKRLSSAGTARSGNTMAAIGMLIAIVATLVDRQVLGFGTILAGMVLGGAIGTWSARKVQMTDMPQMVALFNGSGGGAAALVSTAEFLKSMGNHDGPGQLATILLGAFIGALSFTGSIVAWAKLQGVMDDRAFRFPQQRLVNVVVAGALVVLGAYLSFVPCQEYFLWFLGVSLLLGFSMVIPIGGGDMPVVISLLNSFTGLATAATGFALQNSVLIISGTLVGASGTILTLLMCKAMNRGIASVVFGSFGAAAGGGGAAAATGGQSVRETTPEDAAVMMAYARTVVVVPGYGLAVAQAQHVVRELADQLEGRGVEVRYAIHPVAGRMPGHMNVLLAEANVPYDQLKDMEEINPEFERTDVVLVVGANDVVNPAARTDTSSPIYGMPILDVDKAGHVIVLKRSMRAGFAGIENELFYFPKTLMLFGDAKDSLSKLVAAVKAA